MSWKNNFIFTPYSICVSKKRPPKYKAPVSPKVAPKEETTPPRDYSILITTLFFVVALLGIYKHEMWRDEYQAWLIARDSHSFIQLYRNCLYEGHPMFWHVVLFGLTSITTNLFALQMLNLLFGTGAVYLFCRYSNFSTLQKVLFSFSYYTLYEYSIITRYHSMTLFMVMLFCTLYKNKRKFLPWMCLILFCLSNTALIDNVLAIALSGILLLDFILHYKKEEWKGVSKIEIAAGGIFVLTGIVLSAIQVMPEKDNLFNPSVSDLANPEWIKGLLSRIDNAFLLFREINVLPLWTTVQRVDYKEENINLHLLISLLMLLTISVILM